MKGWNARRREGIFVFLKKNKDPFAPVSPALGSTRFFDPIAIIFAVAIAPRSRIFLRTPFPPPVHVM